MIATLLMLIIALLVFLLAKRFAFDEYKYLNRVKYDSAIKLNTNVDVTLNTNNPWIILFHRYISGQSVSLDNELWLKNNIDVIAHLSENHRDRNNVVREANIKYRSLKKRHKKIAKQEFIGAIGYSKHDKVTSDRIFLTAYLKFKIRDEYVYIEELSESIVDRSCKLKKIK